MRKLTLPVFLLLAVTVTASANDKEKRMLTVRAVTHASQVNERTSYYTTPGNSNTDCNGTGIDTGGGTTSVNMNCTSTSTPAQTHPITTRTVDVVDVVEAEGMRFTISCTAHWVGSNCSPMIDGDLFQAEIDGKTMWIQAHKGGNQGKQMKVKYKILDVRQVKSATPQLQETAPQSGAPTTPASQTQASTNAEIEIASVPSGDDIELDGSFVGSTPSTVGVAGGDHVIIVKKNGYKPWERKLKTSTGKVNIAADLQADIKREPKTEAAVPLQANATPVAVRETAASPPSEVPGRIFVTSSPVGAEIYADSLFVGKTPYTMKLKPGQHSILLVMKDYKNWSQTITAEAGSEVQLTATLEKSN